MYNFWVPYVLNTWSCVNKNSYLDTIAKMLCNINVANLKSLASIKPVVW